MLHKFLKSMCLYYNIPVPSLQRKIYPSEKDMTLSFAGGDIQHLEQTEEKDIMASSKKYEFL